MITPGLWLYKLVGCICCLFWLYFRFFCSQYNWIVNNELCHFGVTFIVNKNIMFLKNVYINVDDTMITDSPEWIMNEKVRSLNIIPHQNANLPLWDATCKVTSICRWYSHILMCSFSGSGCWRAPDCFSVTAGLPLWSQTGLECTKK